MKKVISTLSIIVLAISVTSCNDYRRNQNQLDAESDGKSILLKAESSKKANIEEAKARYESSLLDSKTRLIKAEAAAQASIVKANAEAKNIEKISEAIRKNPEYLKFKMIEGIRYGKTVYIPTEASLPIIERR